MLKFIVILLFPILAFAQLESDSDTEQTKNESTKRLVVQPMSSPVVDSYDRDFINRIAISVSARQRDYQILISGIPDSKRVDKTLYYLEVIATPIAGNKIDLEARINNKAKGIIEKRVIRRNIEKEDIRSVAEDSLLILFGFDPVNFKTVPEKTSKKKPPFPLLKEAKKKKSTVDFRKRIMKLKKDIKIKFAQIKEKEKDLKDEEEKKDDNKKSKQKSAGKQKGAFSFLKDKDVYQKRNTDGERGTLYTFKNWYSLGLLSSNYLILDRVDTSEEVQIRTKVFSVLVNAYAEMWSEHSDIFALFGRLGLVAPQSVEQIEPSNSFELDLGVLAAFFDESLYFKLGLRKDKQFFANLPILGGGLKTAEVDVWWLLASGHYLFWQRKMYFKYEYSSQLTSSFEEGNFNDGTLSIQRAKLRLGFSTDFIYEGSYFELAYQPTYFKIAGTREVQGEDTSIFGLMLFSF